MNMPKNELYEEIYFDKIIAFQAQLVSMATRTNHALYNHLLLDFKLYEFRFFLLIFLKSYLTNNASSGALTKMLIKDITVIYHSTLGISHYILPFYRRTSSILLCL